MSPEPPGSATHGRGRCDTDRVGEHSQVKSVSKAALSVTERQPAGLRLARGPEPEDKERVGMRSWRACRSHAHLMGVRGGLRMGTALGSV